MRKSAWTGLLAVATLIAAALVGFLLPTSASADDAYNFGTCGSIAVSATNVNPGESITVTGSGFVAHKVVHLTLTPAADGTGAIKHYGPVTTDAHGKFTLSIVMPLKSTGHQILTSDSVGTITRNGVKETCPADPIQLLINAGGNGGSSQPPAHTGVDIALLFGVAAILLGAGVLFTRGGKRRRIAAQS